MKRLIVLALALMGIVSVVRAEAYQPCDWERQIVAACLVLEASNQGEHGMQAVASVIANRAERDKSRYIQIVKTPYAFTALNEASTGKTGSSGFANHVRRASRDLNWSLALRIVDQLYADSLADNTYGADHYSRRDQLPSWSHRMRATAVIGDHLFFRAL
ncbi:cell wall hydrolase [Pelagicoccus sp. SDUM812003]|uniref:cell wall hydrolase n=1 Tax=Pelagicoccus sp. SDUM812003 TaxID=3041267 RepID=UPI00280FEB93|nr:cell wall hydrolase [Pelagicoccus sp. SDUM812003]MDQ8205853.1 cell wall hydrolase [Pelagicoccus sp. SDUM812003]